MVGSPEVSGAPDLDDLKNFFLGSAVIAVAFAAFYGEFSNVSSYLFYLPAAAFILFMRELGVRLAVNLLDGYVDLEIAGNGSTTTLFGSIMAVVSGLPIILLFPIYSEVSRKQYENWGKSTDVVWALYKYKVAKWGISFLILGFLVVNLFGAAKLGQMFAVFTFFQMLPLDYSGFPTGPLDGAEILRWSGFYWLIFTGISLLFIAFTAV